MWYFIVLAILMICAGLVAAAVIIGEEKRAREPKHLRPRSYKQKAR